MRRPNYRFQTQVECLLRGVFPHKVSYRAKIVALKSYIVEKTGWLPSALRGEDYDEVMELVEFWQAKDAWEAAQTPKDPTP